MEPYVVSTRKGQVDPEWVKRMRAHRADPSAPKPGPCKTVQTWTYSDKSVRQVVVGGDLPPRPIKVNPFMRDRLVAAGCNVR